MLVARHPDGRKHTLAFARILVVDVVRAWKPPPLERRDETIAILIEVLWEV